MSGWLTLDGGFTEEEPPTHWMPLLDPPKGEGVMARKSGWHQCLPKAEGPGSFAVYPEYAFYINGKVRASVWDNAHPVCILAPGIEALRRIAERNHPGDQFADVWRSFFDGATWHTWDTRGVGGENAHALSVDDAKREAEAALVRQGWM